MYLKDLKCSDTLLVDSMDGQTLNVAHGAPLRLLAPAHYGYKSAKHISRIEFLSNADTYQPSGLRFMDHPRARVELEERGSIFPGWFLRRRYRPLVKSTAAKFSSALTKHNSREDPSHTGRS
jgi:DMSO/TMAO reductase YedYZ molybdopterin-dependent catalytic subunit